MVHLLNGIDLLMNEREFLLLWQKCLQVVSIVASVYTV